MVFDLSINDSYLTPDYLASATEGMNEPDSEVVYEGSSHSQQELSDTDWPPLASLHLVLQGAPSGSGAWFATLLNSELLRLSFLTLFILSEAGSEELTFQRNDCVPSTNSSIQNKWQPERPLWNFI